MAVLRAQVARKVGERRGNAHVVQSAQPAERQREHEVVGFVQLSGGAVALRVDARRDGAAQHAVAHERVSPVANAKVGVRVDVRHMERRSQPSFPNQVVPVKQRAVVRWKYSPRDGTRAVQVEMILQKCAHLRFRPRLGGAFRRALALRREGTGVGQEEIKINVEYPRHRAFLRCIAGFKIACAYVPAHAVVGCSPSGAKEQELDRKKSRSMLSTRVMGRSSVVSRIRMGRDDAHRQRPPCRRSVFLLPVRTQDGLITGLLRVVLRQEGAGMMRIVSAVPAVRQCSFCLCVRRTA